MIPMTEEMRTLFKSKVMVGNNSPTASVVIQGAPSSEPSGSEYWFDIVDGIIEYHNISTTIDKREVSNFVTDSSGNEFCVVAYGGYLLKAIMANNEDYLIKDNCITEYASLGVSIEAIDVDNLGSSRVQLLKLGDRSILMFVYTPAISGRGMDVKCYKSVCGSGTDFTLLSTVTTEPARSSVSARGQGIKSILVTSTGRILVSMTGLLNFDATYSFPGIRIMYSDNNGVTWNLSLNYKTGGYEHHGQLVQLKDGTIIFPYVSGSAATYWYYSTNNGTSWGMEQSNAAGWAFSNGYLDGLALYGDYLYASTLMKSNGKSFGYISNPTFEEMKIKENWTWVNGQWQGTYRQVFLIYPNYRNRLVFQYVVNDKLYAKIAGFAPPPEIEINIKSAEVDISKGMASQAVVVMDNKDGIYSPDKTGLWHQIIWPNKTLSVKLGYGSYLPTVFTGMIDRVTMRTFPQEIEITCRDMLKRALDQLVYLVVDNRTIYTVLYQWQTPEYIFRDLAIKAGWADADVYTECSGITLESITFTHESIADAFQRLSELAGFEFYCDEGGGLHFVHATDRSPAITSASATLTGIDYVAVAGVPTDHPMVDGSVVVKSTDGSVTYTKDVDYSVRLGSSTEPAAICRIVGGAIADGQTVYVSCVYAAWVFKEGQDIISLDYSITDQDIYRRIIVISQDAEGAFVRGDEDFNGIQYYGVLPHKVMIVQAGDLASSSEQCTSIAARIGAATLTKPRETNFEAVGHPYIQVGDCIQVIESSSTISEIYRITNLTHLVTPDGYRTRMTAYHYGYAPI